MFKFLVTLGLIIYIFPSIAHCNQAYEKKIEILLKAKKNYSKKKLSKLEKLRQSIDFKEFNHWIDYWILKLKIEKNPFKKEIRNLLFNFSKNTESHFLTAEAYKFWAHEMIKSHNWIETEKNVKFISKKSPDSISPSINCVKHWSKKKIDVIDLENLTRGHEFRIGCLKLISYAITNKIPTRGFVIRSARSASIKGKFSHAKKILNLAKKNGYEISNSEFKLIKVLSVSQKNSLRSLRRLKSIFRLLSQEQKNFAYMAVGSALHGITHSKTHKMIRDGISSANDQPSEILESSARVALRYEDWDLLGEIISSMPLKLQRSSKWKYWEAQRLLNREEQSKSIKLLNSIRPQWSFYGLLASEDQAKIFNPKSQISYRIPIKEKNAELIIESTGFNSALLLYDAGLYKEARKEWEEVLKNSSDKTLINIAKHVSGLKIYDRGISAALKTKLEHNFYLRFPTPYSAIVMKESKLQKISPPLVMALMRQESRFKKLISSPAGAIGLMQLMPSTARAVSRKMEMKPVGRISLQNPEINIKIGIRYLRDLYKRFNDSNVLSVAAYNAGPNRSKKWKNSLRKKISGAAFTESIPFDETREYVKLVLSGTVIYSRLYSKQLSWNFDVRDKSILTLNSLLGSVQQ